jgi:hypothetical protein
MRHNKRNNLCLYVLGLFNELHQKINIIVLVVYCLITELFHPSIEVIIILSQN